MRVATPSERCRRVMKSFATNLESKFDSERELHIAFPHGNLACNFAVTIKGTILLILSTIARFPSSTFPLIWLYSTESCNGSQFGASLKINHEHYKNDQESFRRLSFCRLQAKEHPFSYSTPKPYLPRMIIITLPVFS